MKQFYRRRKLDTDPGVERVGGEMNRLYVVEPTPTVTGSSADHQLPLRASQMDAFARALAAKLGVGGAEGSATIPPAAEKWLESVTKNLQGHRGSSLVIAGEHVGKFLNGYGDEPSGRDGDNYRLERLAHGAQRWYPSLLLRLLAQQQRGR